MYIDDNTLFTKNEKELEILIQEERKYSDDITTCHANYKKAENDKWQKECIYLIKKNIRMLGERTLTNN